MTKETGLWHRIARLPRAVPELGMAVTGPFVLLDLARLAKANPAWAGPLSLLPWALMAGFFVSASSLIAIAVARSRTKESYLTLKQRSERGQQLEDVVAANIRQLVDGMLLELARQLELSEDDQSRLTLYVVTHDDYLINVGRFATNPEHTTSDRKAVPKNQGCIAIAWRDHWAYIGDLGRGNTFIKRCQETGIPEDLAKKMIMKPRTIAALRICDSRQVPLGVLVFESMQPNRFLEHQLEMEMKSFSYFFQHTIPALLPHIPDPAIASGKGF